MIKILVASAEVKNIQDFCQFLTNDKKFFIFNASTVHDILDKYLTLQPDVLIIDTNLGVSNCINIINKISILSNNFHKCHTIIVATYDEANNIIIQLDNFSKVYKILYKPFDIEKTLDVINEITPILVIPELTFDDIIPIFLLLNLSISAKGSTYLMASIIACYYFPFLLENLETDVYKKIAEYYNTTQDKVRVNIRNTLLTLNATYINKTKFPLFKLFDFKDNTTPKRFIEILSIYFRHKKKK